MTLRILLVEENTSERNRLTIALQSGGYRVQPVEDTNAARATLFRSSMDLAVVSTLKDDGTELDLVQWLRSQASPIAMPILVVADDITAKARLASLRAGANDYIARPFDQKHFLSRISNLLAHRESRPSAIPQGFSRRILVVDDSPTYGYALSDEMRKDGHDVAFADTGRDALSYLESQKADLVILDVFLPDINGVEVCRRIKTAERTANLPVLVMTGREKSAVRAEATEANADEFVVKSADLETIRNKVKTLLVRAPNRKISTNRLAAVVVESSPQQGASSSRMRVAPVAEAAISQRSPSLSKLRAASGSPLSSSTPDDLFDNIVRLTGLSELLARSTVESVCRRLELNAHALEPQDLPKVIEALERSLQLFLPAGEAKQRLAALHALVR